MRWFPLWLLPACDVPLPEAEVVHAQPLVSSEAFTQPEATTLLSGEEGPFACPGSLGTPDDGGFQSEPAADPDSALVGLPDVPRRLHILPGADAAHEMTVVWQTTSATVGGRVEVGLAGSPSRWTIPGESYVVDAMRIHVARICGLTEGRTWVYRAGAEEGWSAEAEFTTAPLAGVDSPVRVAVMGDSRDYPQTFASMLVAAQDAGADLLVFTGDAVMSGSSWTDWEEWFDAAEVPLASMPMLFVPGNHEQNDLYYYALFPSPTGAGHGAYSVGPLQFLAVNDTQSGGVLLADEAAWLTDALAESTAPWPIPAWHKPAVSSCKPHGEDANNKSTLLPVVEAAPAVRLVLNGHNHNYERSHPLRGGVVGVADGITHLVSGGAGAPLYTSSYGQAYTATELKENHWVLLDATASRIEGTVYDVAGNVIDRFTLTR